jgi:invasion protein IalB
MTIDNVTRGPILAALLALALTGAAAAQDSAAPATEAPATEAPATEAPATPAAPAADTPAATATEAPATPAADAPAADGPGSVYLAETHGDWERRCARAPEGQPERCQLFQLLEDKNGNPTAQMVLFRLPTGNDVLAGAEITVPLETLLTAGLKMQVDTAKPSVFPYAFCDPVGCVAQVGFAASDVDAFKKGGAAKLVLVPALAPTQQVELTVSLKGFTAGYDALTVPEAPVPPADGN